MSYGLIYTIPFASLRKEACTVEIEKENYAGVSTELIASESPFEVEIEDDDFLYVPTRFSTARIRVVGSDYLQELYSTAYQQYRVTFKCEGVVRWIGFVKPEVYTQDYSSDKFELEIECVSALSTLEYINYKQVGTDRKIFVSIWDLLKKCVELSRGPYSAVYIPHVYAKDASSYAAGTNVLADMTISEQNFFDEDDKPMTMKEILEEIVKFLNWTCADYLGSLYFVDIDHVGDYYAYTADFTVSTRVTPVKRYVQQIGFAGSEHSLDYIPGYNKVKLKTSNYPVGDLLPREDFKTLTVAENPADVTEGKKVSHKKVLLPAMWDMKQYIGNIDETQIVEVSKDWVTAHKDKANMLMGAMPIRFCEYNLKDDLTPDISSYNYEDAIQVRSTTKAPPEHYSACMDWAPILVIRGASAIYSEGALSISGSIRECTNAGMGVVGGYGGYGADSIRCLLRIGKYWFDGKSWVVHPGNGEIISFNVQFEDCKEGVAWNNVKNTKTLDMPYNGLTGFIIPIDKSISGDLELTIHASNFYVGSPQPDVNEYGYFLKGFKFSYQKKDDSANEDSNSDRFYENVVNENYINELDEIEFKISSYNNDGACYSKVMLGDNYLTDNLYSSNVARAVRPEEHLIQRIVNRYSDTHIKLTQVIQSSSDLTPITILSDKYMVSNKFSNFINAGGSIDYKSGRFKCIMINI